MAIDSPTTYGDYYWASQLEAQRLFDETIEGAVAPFLSGILADIPNLELLPTGVLNTLQALTAPKTAGMGGFALGVGVEMIDETLHTALNPAMRKLGRLINTGALETWLTSGQANLLYHRKKIIPELWDGILASEGYETVLRNFLYRSQQPYPSIPDLLLYSRHHGDPANVWGTVQAFVDIDPVDFPIWQWLSLQRLTTEQKQSLYKRGLLDESDFGQALARGGWSEDKRAYIKDLSYLIPNAMLLVQGDLQQGVDPAKIIEDISRADIHPNYAQQYLDAILTKPASLDLVAYELRQDPQLSDLPRKLQKIGIHPDYLDVYKTLAYPIPPIADLVTMAVREAFTPAIAAKFGQYEDFPPEFERWAMAKGVSKEWSERYWASHWALPSATQGFAMLHRGIIDDTELRMLLRALDVMPFWRDKLIKVAYRPLTRVDVRRMYKEGILDEAGVYKAYLDHGYSEDNAKAMTDFTVSYVLTQLSRFTSTDITNAYTKRMITNSEAGSLLRELNIRSEDVSYILSTADYKREWALTDSKISAIRNMYKRKQYDDNQARSELLKLDLPTEQVDVLMEQWWYEEKDEPVKTWTTAQTLGFMKAGFITQTRGRQELKDIGYDTEHIEVYMRSAQSEPETE